MAMLTRSSYFQVQSAYEQIFRGLSLEELWCHPKLQLFKSKRTREILTLELDKNIFFVKRFYGPGDGLFKYFVRGFRDKYGPENEWQKAHFLAKLGIKAVQPVAFGIERRYGIISRAILITLKLKGYRLEDLLREKINLDRKRSLVEKLAAFAGHFHTSGLSHQDFYLCHLFWSQDSKEIILVDLQRIRHYQGQNRQPRIRWVVKDLAQLDYSARKVLDNTEYNHLKKTFVSVYKQYLPLIVESTIVSKIQKKVARISRHDQKLQARAGARTK
ncbi:MAG: lipopolysaccharide kinase InaA family protein [Syntrophobacterales bacterium]|jgi:heptose I phosphotransferase